MQTRIVSNNNIEFKDIKNYWARNSFRWEKSRYGFQSYFNPLAISIKHRLWIAAKLVNQNVNNVQSWLDVGCGAGRLLSKIQNPKFSYTGIDISQESIDFAKSRFAMTTAEFIRTDICNFSSEKKFDGLILLGILDWINVDKIFESIPIDRAKIIVVSFTENKISWLDFIYYKYVRQIKNVKSFPIRYSKNTICSFFNSAGFKLEKSFRYRPGAGVICLFIREAVDK